MKKFGFVILMLFCTMLMAQTVNLRVRNLNNVRMCDQFSGANAGLKIAACIADLPATGGTADARGLEGAQTLSTALTINKPVRLMLAGMTLAMTAEINVTSDYVFIDCAETVLKAGTVSQNIIHWSAARGGISGNCTLDGNLIAGTSALRISPISESGTTVLTITSFNNFHGLFIKNAAEGIVLAPGPTVTAVQSDVSYNNFFGTTLLDNIRGIWLKPHPSDTGAASPDSNRFFGILCYSTSTRTNTCTHIDAGGTNEFYAHHSIGMANGTSPNTTPTAFYILGRNAITSTNNDSNHIFGLRTESDTRCFVVSSSFGNFNAIHGASGCTTAKISDSGTGTRILDSPYTDKNGTWYSYTDATGIVTLNPALGLTIAPAAGPITISAIGNITANTTGQYNFSTVVTSGTGATFSVPSGTQKGFLVSKNSTADNTHPAFTVANGAGGGTDVFNVYAGGNTLATGTSSANIQQSTVGTWPTDFPTCDGTTAGSMKGVSNSNVSTFGTAISGTGANAGIAYCDGTNWTFR